MGWGWDEGGMIVAKSFGILDDRGERGTQTRGMRRRDITVIGTQKHTAEGGGATQVSLKTHAKLGWAATPPRAKPARVGGPVGCSGIPREGG